MNKLLPILTRTVILLLTLGMVIAQSTPDGFDPATYEEGAYLFGAEEGNSWTQKIWVNVSNLGVWNKRLVNYQFRICTNPSDSNGAQVFEAPDAFQLRGYAQPSDTIWDVGFASNNGVTDALMYANGEPTAAVNGDFVWVTFLKGTADIYPNPYDATWFDTPEFVLQMQAYGYHPDDPSMMVLRYLNKEFYHRGADDQGDGTGWGGSGDVNQPRPAYDSGYTRNVLGKDWACGEWLQDEPIDVVNTPPAADAGGPYLVGVGETIMLDGSGSYDADGEVLSYMWTQDLPLGAFNDPSLESPDFTGVMAGITDLTLVVNDGKANDSDIAMVVVYDPSSGFVTGGGWIYSEPGSYVPDPTLEGKASFGFVSKYKKGASVPTGNTEFYFKTAGLNFHSTNYDWLIVNQGGENAQFKGSGTINGTGDYKFMLWAGDDSPDTFRMKIWEEVGGVELVRYDNGFDQPLDGGSIVIHTKKN